MHRGRKKATAWYVYEDENHTPICRKVRYEPKSFGWERFEDGEWLPGLNGIQPPLYRLPEIRWAVDLAADEEFDPPTLYVAEGEKDVAALVEQGLEATCAPDGSNTWRPEHTEALRGFTDVVFIADNDKPGYKFAAKVVGALLDDQVPVRAVKPAMDLKDAWEHFNDGYGDEDFVPIDLTAPGDNAPIPTWDHLLSKAVEMARETTRHNACFWLVCQLRDNRYDEDFAWTTTQRFQADVTGMKDHPFTGVEARAVFDSTFHTEPRDPFVIGTQGWPLTDSGNAERLVAAHREDLRYCHAWRSWLVWDEKRWRPDDDGEIERWSLATMRDLAKSALDEPDQVRRERLVNWAMKSESDSRITAMIRRARVERAVVVRPSELDRDPMTLVVENGELMLDAHGFKLMTHCRGSLNTKLAPVQFNEKATAPAWDAFLERVMPDRGDRSFLRRSVGYALTGDVSEHVMFVLHGSGANGKTTFLETIRAMLGDYAQQAPTDLITVKRPGSIPTEAARLQGARFVSATETEDGTRLAEATVKQLTGGDRITARRLYQDYFEFNPTHKLWLATNHRPVVMGTDDAIWRRLRLIPFEVTIPPEERDRKLSEKLRQELPGILNWALAGLEEWKRDGLGESRHSKEATEEYRRDSDVFGAFLEECCEVGPGQVVAKAQLYSTYEVWASGGNLRPMTKHSFGRKMKERGFKETRQGKANEHVWIGLEVPHLGENGKFKVLPGGRS